MTKVDIRPNEPIEQAIRRFRKKCERDGINREHKKRQFYEKPSAKKKRKRETLKRKLRKYMLRQQKYQSSGKNF